MAKYSVEIKKSAVKEINKLPKNILKKILPKIHSLETEPRPTGSKKLSGKELYRIRIGQYRIVYQIIKNKLVVYIVKVGHRKNIYNQI